MGNFQPHRTVETGHLMRGAIAVILLAGACSAAAQEADKTLMGMRLGIDKLSDVLSRIGNTPMPPRGELAPDELCYAAENPFESTWVVFGSGARGNWEILTHFRVLSSAPAGLTCRRTPLITASLATNSGIHKGMSLQDLRSRFGAPGETQGAHVVFASPGRTLRGIFENERLTAFEIEGSL